ncbi:RNA-binding protein [Liquorilactobacillus aquaticus DSM 21051]|uniref:RNA-binding protein KhpB n=1 Tax=Liquorilactobacillus aquaticus DSM 21051 TaxID=1423725 RepID=A0A0R2CYX2_9LACO|nr:RNA-binding cell elongation regulator Jag/EloR [Liquorilactobacillus aquaticus]KRM96977.1 RNA-binding protein [Liquorilactobacillus aquaticus DSM 21051]
MSRYKGWTVSEAIDNGLTILHKTRNDVKITVLSAGKKGFLGIGKKQAEVEIELNPKLQKKKKTEKKACRTVRTNAQQQKEESVPKRINSKSSEKDVIIRQLGYYLADITEKMGIETSITVDQVSRNVVYNFNTEQEGALIGKHGRILNALQVLAQNYLEQRNCSKMRLTLDVGEYREKRKQTLERLAQNVARDAVMHKKTVYLDAMPSFERKIIHATLAHDKRVITHSRGSEPRRYVIVEPLK